MAGHSRGARGAPARRAPCRARWCGVAGREELGADRPSTLVRRLDAFEGLQARANLYRDVLQVYVQDLAIDAESGRVRRQGGAAEAGSLEERIPSPIPLASDAQIEEDVRRQLSAEGS